MTRYSLTRPEPDSLEKAFALALCEVYVVTSSYARGMSADDRADVPEPMEIDAIEASNSRNGSSSSANRGGHPAHCHASAVGSWVIARPCAARQLLLLRTSKQSTDQPMPITKKRPGSVGAGRPTGWNGSPGPPVATRASSSHVLHAHPNATTANGDTRLIFLRRPLRALLDSGASNNFVRASCLSILPDSVHVRGGPGEVVVKLADGKPHRVSRRELSLPYTFEGFRSMVDFLVIKMNYAFDCILGIPWLARYQPIARSVKRRSGFDVSEVGSSKRLAPYHRRGQDVHDASDAQILLDDAGGPTPSRVGQRRTPSRGENETVVEHGFSPKNGMVVEHGFPLNNETVVERGFPPKNKSVVEREFPTKGELIVERGFPPNNDAGVEHGFPPKNKSVVERGFPSTGRRSSVGSRHKLRMRSSLPRDDDAVEPEVHPRVADVIERGLLHLEGCDSSSSESVASSSSTRSKLKKKSKRRRLKPSRSIISEAPTTESLCVTEYVEGATQRRRVIEVTNPTSNAPSLTRLPGLSWKKFLRELKAGEIEQVCLITDTDSVPHSVNAVSSDEASSRPKNAEPKSAREERFAA
ncbi:LOW QUALITY PROTEIN: polyprotein, partial [Phytophthora megakarya]